MTKKYKVSFVMPKRLYDEFREELIRNKYSMRSKSVWVCEAIVSLQHKSSFEEMVKLNDEMHGLDKAETISLDLETKEALDKAIIKVRVKYPEIDGVKSRIIRTAILQRLLSKG